MRKEKYEKMNDNNEIKGNKSNLIKVIIFLILGIVFLVGSFAIYKEIQKNTFIPEETKLDIYVEGNNIILEAYNSQGLEKMMYRWEGKERYYAQPNKDNTANLSVTIPILSGENTLYIEVIDLNGNQINKEQKIKGATQAQIDIIARNGYFEVSVNDSKKIESIEYEFNGASYVVEIGDTKEFTFLKKLEYGENHIKVVARNLQGIESTKEMNYEL